MATVRICVCGDSGVGKSSLIAGLVKDTFITGRIQAVLPQITIPPIFGMPSVATGTASGAGGAITSAAGAVGENVTTVVVDTSALPEHRDTLNREIKRCNVILLVYADHYSYERLGLFWLPHFRSLGVNVPVILCAAKSDAPDVTVAATVATGGGGGGGGTGHHSHPVPDPVRAFEEETLSLMTEFKEVDSCLRASAKAKHNVREAFFLCQKAVTHPVAPLYDSKEQTLKQAAATALRRVFWLADHDKDGLLSDLELQAFQARCFGKPLEPADLASIKQIIEAASPGSVTEAGIDQRGFLALNKYFIDKGRHETVWIIVRAHHYSDSLSLREAFIHPKFDVPAYSSAELSPTGYQFFFDLFLRFDQDKDGGLNDAELSALFAPTPGLPQSWTDTGASSFPSSTVRNEAGHITLQGWLAQWSMTTFSSPRTTLEYLAYLGFEPPDARSTNAAALKVTKPRKRKSRGAGAAARVERNVVHAYIVGAPGAGKSSLLDAFLSQPFSPIYRPTLSSRVAVNSVELPGGKQCYLILEELGATLEPAVLSNPSRLDACDLLLCTYDSADPDSFTHLTRLLDPSASSSTSHTTTTGSNGKYNKSSSAASSLEFPPAMFVALKADLDRAVQRDDAAQPDEYCAVRGVQKPHHVSVAWDRKSVSELFVAVAEAALRPLDAGSRAGGGAGGAGGGSGGRGVKGSGGGNGGAGGLLGERLGLYVGTGAAVAVVAAGVAFWRRSRQE